MYNALKRVYSIAAVILPITFLAQKFYFSYILTRKYNKFDKIKTLWYILAVPGKHPGK